MAFRLLLAGHYLMMWVDKQKVGIGRRILEIPRVGSILIIVFVFDRINFKGSVSITLESQKATQIDTLTAHPLRKDVFH